SDSERAGARPAARVRERLRLHRGGDRRSTRALGARSLQRLAGAQWRSAMSRPAMAGLALASLCLAGCVGTPRVSGVPGASPAPQTPWQPPAEALRKLEAADTSTPASLPPDLGDRIRRLTLVEIVDIGLRNNPGTRLAWANAQAAAATYGSSRGERLPTVDGNVTATRLKTVASQGRTAVEQSVLTPSASLSYLLFDFGGRSGRVESSRQQLLAAGFTHNASIQ